MSASADLQSRLRGGRRLLGTFSFTCSAACVELAGLAGFDFVIIDCEHAPLSPYGGELEALVRAAQAGGAIPVVRVGSVDDWQIGKVLDAGAAGVLVPRVSSAGELRRAVAAAARPPHGLRGSAPMVRAAAYGLAPWPEHLRATRPPAPVGALVESPQAVEAIDEIAAVEGLGFLFFGGFDLAIALGKDDPAAADGEVERARALVYAAARARALPLGDFAADAPRARALLARGAQLVAAATDLSLLAQAMRGLALQVRADMEAAPAGPAAVPAGSGGWR